MKKTNMLMISKSMLSPIIFAQSIAEASKAGKKIALSAFALLLIGSYSYGQLTYRASGATNTAGTYTGLGTNGTVITTANFDDANSAPVDIGFSFNYGCGTFTQFILNTNGFIKMGSAPPSAANLFYTESNSMTGGVMNSTDTADSNILAVFNHDLSGAPGAEYRVYTSGTAPSRVTTIQFKNLVDSSSSSSGRPTIPMVQYGTIEFQIKLYEGSNKIEFVYGTWTSSGNPPAFKTAAIGLKTTHPVPAVTVTKISSAGWNAATFLDGNYTRDPFNHRNEFLPVPGRKYTFTPSAITLVNDIAVTEVYSLGDLPIGIVPQPIVSVILENKNICNDATININLNVTGTQIYDTNESITVPAARIMIHEFSGYNPTAEGLNHLTVSIPADSDNSNNTGRYRQAVSQDKINYFDTTLSIASAGFNQGPGGMILAKYTITESRKVVAVTVFIANDFASENRTMKAVVLNANGSIIGTSNNFVPTSGDLGQFHTLTITSPPLIENNSFYVGLALTGSGYSPIGIQEELPPRQGVYYGASLSGGQTTEVLAGRLMIGAVLGPEDTGMDDGISLSKDFFIYPNPSPGLINIRLEKDYTSAVEITISDILGKKFYTETLLNANSIGDKSIDLSQLPEGMYVIQLISEGKPSTKKLVLTK